MNILQAYFLALKRENTNSEKTKKNLSKDYKDYSKN